MNMPETESLSVKKADVATTTIFVSVNLEKIINDVKNSLLLNQYDGKGKKIVKIPRKLEGNYISYSENASGTPAIASTFDMVDGNNIVFQLQDTSGAAVSKLKWNGIVQDYNNLTYIKSLSKDLIATYSVTYLPRQPITDLIETDDIDFYIKFTNGNDKFVVYWDPKVKIRR